MYKCSDRARAKINIYIIIWYLRLSVSHRSHKKGPLSTTAVRDLGMKVSSWVWVVYKCSDRARAKINIYIIIWYLRLSVSHRSHKKGPLSTTHMQPCSGTRLSFTHPWMIINKHLLCRVFYQGVTEVCHSGLWPQRKPSMGHGTDIFIGIFRICLYLPNYNTLLFNRVFTDKLTSLVTACTVFVYGVTTSEIKYYFLVVFIQGSIYKNPTPKLYMPSFSDSRLIELI